MKNILQNLNLHWMSGSNLSDNQHFTTLNSIGKCLTYPLFLLLIALAVCGCQKDQEPIVSETNAQLSSPAPAAEADSLKSVLELESVSQWRVMAINKVESSFTFDLSTEGTTVCFANSEATFSVPYNVFTFNPDSEPTTEYDQYGPYSVSYLSSNTLSIADEQFKVSAMADGGYALIAEDLTIVITE